MKPQDLEGRYVERSEIVSNIFTARVLGFLGEGEKLIHDPGEDFYELIWFP